MDSAFENLIRCSKAGNVEGVVEAVREGAQIDQLVVGTGTTAGPSALHIASTANKLEVVKKLLSLGASVNVVNNFGFTPLHHASEGGNLRVVETLLEAGADPHASNTSGRTPLALACKAGKLDVAQTLVRHGADLKTTDNKGAGLLFFAAFGNKLDAAKWLIKEGVDALARDNSGCLAQDVAHRKGFGEVEEYLTNLTQQELSQQQQLNKSRLKNAQISLNGTTTGALLDSVMIHSSSRINIDDAVSRKEGPMHLVVQGANPLIQPSDHIYNTIMDPPGRVLILNYKNFNTDKLSTRKGSDHDVINLINLYSQMGYITEHHTDLTGDETRAVIKGFIKKQMVKHAGCLIIVVMSHGVDEGYSFYTTDKNMFAISDLRKNFTETEGLKSVPKLFFFQFCRGSAEPQAQIHTDGFQQSPENIIYFFATSKGFVSYRDPNSGAPFIKTWCKVLAEHSHRMNLEELYCEFKLQFESKSNGAKPEKESHDFSKKFYFNPRSEN